MVAYDPGQDAFRERHRVARRVRRRCREGCLAGMVERTQIERMPDGRILFHDGGADEELAPDTPCR